MISASHALSLISQQPLLQPPDQTWGVQLRGPQPAGRAPHWKQPCELYRRRSFSRPLQPANAVSWTESVLWISCVKKKNVKPNQKHWPDLYLILSQPMCLSIAHTVHFKSVRKLKDQSATGGVSSGKDEKGLNNCGHFITSGLFLVDITAKNSFRTARKALHKKSLSCFTLKAESVCSVRWSVSTRLASFSSHRF